MNFSDPMSRGQVLVGATAGAASAVTGVQAAEKALAWLATDASIWAMPLVQTARYRKR